MSWISEDLQHIEYGQTDIVSRYGDNDFSWQSITMPRKRIYEIRQQCSAADGNISQVFDVIRIIAEGEKENQHHVVFPHGDGLTLHVINTVDHPDYNNKNDAFFRGTKEKVMEKLQKSLKARGYDLRKNACFNNVDVIQTLHDIADHYTDSCDLSFRYTIHMILESMHNKYSDKQFLWLCNNYEVWCFHRRDVYIKDSIAYQIWFNSSRSGNGPIKAFWIKLKDIHGKAMGDIVELDYQKHLDYLYSHSFDPYKIKIVFAHTNNNCVLKYQDYIQNKPVFAQYLPFASYTLLVEDSAAFEKTMKDEEEQFLDNVEQGEVEVYVKQLDYDKLHDYGYKCDDLDLITSMEASSAFAYGLTFYALNSDSTKVQITDYDVYMRYDGDCLYGMHPDEKKQLRHMRDELLTYEEMLEELYPDGRSKEDEYLER